MENTYVGEMIQKLGDRLQILELQAASYGIDAPPQVLTEIQDIKSRIEQLQMSTKSLVSIELLQRMTPLEIWKRLYDAIWEIELIIHTIKKNIESDTVRIQKRHTEFNISVQRNSFEIELLKRGYSSIRFWFIVFVVVVILMLFGIALFR